MKGNTKGPTVTLAPQHTQLPSFDAVYATLAAHRADLAKRYHLSELGVFGSFARGEQQPGSDIDVLVDFETTPSLFALIALEDELHSLLGLPVDLAVKSALRPHVGAHILREVVPV